MVDVTNLDSLRYAFVNWHEGRGLKPYGSNQKVLEHRTLIDSNSLASAWPEGGWESSVPEIGLVEQGKYH